MFEDVSAMEKEIDTFRKNVIASSELVDGISSLTTATKQQKEEFSSRSAELLDKLDKCVAQFKADHEAALDALSKENTEMITEMQEKLSAEQNACIAQMKEIQASIENCAVDSRTDAEHELAQLTSECERLIGQMQAAVQTQQDTYIAELKASSAIIKEYQTSAEKNYEDFKKTLQDTAVDQILKEVQDIKKNVQTKFMVLLGGVGVTLVIAVLGLVLK